MNDEADQKKRQGERNPAASLQQRLRNHARSTGDDVSLVLIRYMSERFLYPGTSNGLISNRYFLEGSKMSAQSNEFVRAVVCVSLNIQSLNPFRQRREHVPDFLKHRLDDLIQVFIIEQSPLGPAEP